MLAYTDRAARLGSTRTNAVVSSGAMPRAAWPRTTGARNKSGARCLFGAADLAEDPYYRTSEASGKAVLLAVAV